MPAKSRSSKSGKASLKKADTTQLGEGSASCRNSGIIKSSSQVEINSTSSLLQKVLEPGVKLTPAEALAASHWIRQIIAFFTGIAFGALRLTGFPPIVTFCFISFTGPFSFLSSFHQLDLDEIKEVGTIQTEGFFPSTALFFLTWILSYTIFLPQST